MRKIVLLLGLTLSVWSLDIEEAIQMAMQHSPALSKAQSNVDYARSNELGAQAGFHPRLDAHFNWRDVDKTTTFTYSPAYNYNLSAKYNIFNGFIDKAKMDASVLETEVQRLLLIARKEDVKLSVMHAYTGHLKAKKAVLTQEDKLNSLTRSYNDTKVRYEQGIISKNELLLIDVDRLEAQKALVAAKSDVVRTRENLARVMGSSLSSKEPVDEISSELSFDEEIEGLIQRTLDNRSELKALYKQKAALEEKYTAASNFYPSVDLEGEYKVNDKSLVFNGGLVQQKETFTSMINVSWNLYNGRSDEALRKGILEQINAVDADIKTMQFDLRYQIIDAYEVYRTAKYTQDVAKRAEESAQESFRITKDRYDYGKADTLTLLKTQSNLTTAQNAYNDAFYNLYIALQTIQRISGE